MNGLTQSTAAKILALEKLTELDVLRILDAAFNEHAEPNAREAENCKQLVNEANDKANTAVQQATNDLAAKQNELIEAREQLKDARGKIATSAEQIGELQERIEGIRAENDRIVAEAAQCHQRNAELVTEHGELRKKIAALEAIPIEPPPEPA